MSVNRAAVQGIIDSHAIVVFSKTYCPYCAKAKRLLSDVAKGKPVHVLELDTMNDGAQYQAVLLEMTKQRTVPNIFINKQHIGGSDDLHALHAQGKLVPLLSKI